MCVKHFYCAGLPHVATVSRAPLPYLQQVRQKVSILFVDQINDAFLTKPFITHQNPSFDSFDALTGNTATPAKPVCHTGTRRKPH